MTDLPLHVVRETPTTVTLGWTPIPCLGYVLYADGVRKSNSWDPAKSSWKTNKASVIRIVAVGAEATGVYPPVVPPPAGTPVSPNGWAAAFAAAKTGDTLVAQPGQHPKVVLPRSLAATITCASGAVLAGVDTNSQSYWTFDSIVSTLPVEVNDYNITPFYLHGGSQQIKLTGAFKLSGGYDAIKVYGGCKDCVVDDGGAGSSLSGYGGDGIHINQATNLWVRSIGIGAPWQEGATPEHNDGIHAQDFTNLRLGDKAAGVGPRIEALGPRSDVDSGGMFLRGEPGATTLLIDWVEIHWQIGRAIQIIDIDGQTTINHLKITDSGVPGESPAITFDGRYDVNIYGPTIGFTANDCYPKPPNPRVVWH